jgi:hypothetical protein
LDGAVDVFVTVKGCQYNDPRVFIAGPNLLDRANAIELGHS